MLRTVGSPRRTSQPVRLLVWSAGCEDDEEALRVSLRRWIKARGETGFAGVADAWGSAVPGAARGALVAADPQEALAALDAQRPGAFRGLAELRRPVAVLLPGQGAQHPRMALGLYGHEQVFTAAVDEVFALLGPAGEQVRDDWLAENPRLPIDHVERALPLIFALDLALGRLLTSWGIRPALLLGQGIGEHAAATLAGVLSLPAAVAVIGAQAERLAQAPAGGMVAVAAGADQVAPHLPPGVAVAAVNSANQTVISGTRQGLARAAEALRAAELSCMPVRAQVAYHSPVVAAACAEAARAFERVSLLPPAIPVLSASTAALMAPGEAVDPGFWARQPTRPVQLRATFDTLFAGGGHLCLEAGPGQGLYSLIRRHPAFLKGPSQAVAMLSARPRNAAHDRRSVLEAAARLWTAGQDLDLEAIHRLG
ncbi:acyltransferase domain-containing protein [Kitasatospora sp. NBC_01287]|uniref:acyltransferase domain-containing protein n=1 Tax=Kitasatospora sp. NBC_01287 TaxID=2903573 RepID=UPI002254F990|nr:acyltransferase domain-containing protein [Kitasatospora sp. NBC_01287]MCX4748883.1 acyltransferase domain-containing protein [Kitasatospora sp. NBC_01287]